MAPTSGAKALIRVCTIPELWKIVGWEDGITIVYPGRCEMCMKYASHLMDTIRASQMKLWARCWRGSWHCLALDHQKHPTLSEERCKGERPWPQRRGQGNKRQGQWPWGHTDRPTHQNRKPQGYCAWPWEGTQVIQKDLNPSQASHRPTSGWSIIEASHKSTSGWSILTPNSPLVVRATLASSGD